MLRLKDFQDYQVSNSVQIKGGEKVRTDGGNYQASHGSFNYGYDYRIDTPTGLVTAFCDITNSTMGPDTCGGPECDC
jgi:hypothetical protein